jgi:hypothetical protein
MTSGRSSHRRKRRLRVSLGTTPLFTADVSAGGFSAEILRAPAPGTPVAGTIRVANSEVRYAGEVVWAKAGAPSLNLHGRIGVRFTAIPDPVAELLAAPVVPGH